MVLIANESVPSLGPATRFASRNQGVFLPGARPVDTRQESVTWRPTPYPVLQRGMGAALLPLTTTTQHPRLIHTCLSEALPDHGPPVAATRILDVILISVSSTLVKNSIRAQLKLASTIMQHVPYTLLKPKSSPNPAGKP